jgi:hypothetical protein
VTERSAGRALRADKAGDMGIAWLFRNAEFIKYFWHPSM